MSRSLLLAVTAVAMLLVALALFVARGAVGPPPDRVAGDISEIVAGEDPETLALQAEAFLASDRPWRATQSMRRYMELVPDAPADRRLLAARGEAGWGAWTEVRALLEHAPALDALDEGIGLYLLGRAYDETGEPALAADTYAAFLTLSPPVGSREEERAAARLRLGLALVRTGDRPGAENELRRAAELLGGGAMWIELLEADALAATGDTAAVRQAVARFDSGFAGLRAWRARIAAARRAGDVPAARALANRARAWARTDETRAEFLVSAGGAALEMGDVAAARDAFRSTIDWNPANQHAREAARLLETGDPTPSEHLALARVARAQGLHEVSLEGYRRWLEAGLGDANERTGVLMEHANALFYAERYDEVEAALAPISGRTEALFLLARAEAHRDHHDEAVRIYLSLADRFTGTADGVQALYLAAGTRHDEGDFSAARELYQRVVGRYGSSSQGSLARMRMAGMAFVEEDFREAARIWDAYRTASPRGAHALEATYWAGRARAELGDSTGAASLFREVRQRERDSYYALLASDRLGEPFWPVPMGPTPPESPAAAERVRTWMRGVDLLRSAGFPDEAAAEADRLGSVTGLDRPTRYALAEALAERGYSRRAIQMGLGLQASDGPDRRLLRILHPFPYAPLVTAEARERDLDPFIAAALIRQESMFEARITSPAGARGLMQIMPLTGLEIAGAAGLEDWSAELLYHPEINAHLGTRYLAQQSESHDGSLPAMFSAYNAGPHRVEWWSEFAEYEDRELFTERIPFRETREYVKILTRNHAMYRGLYGDG